MFATSHLWCSLPWWIHCPLTCSVAKESQRTFHLCGERFSFVDWTTESSLIRRSANFGNVSPFSSTSRGNKHIFRAYPSTLKVAELCFETTAANSTIIWSARLVFLPLREAGKGFVGVLPLPSTHVWSSRKHYVVHGNNAQDCFRYFLAKSITGCVKFTKRTEFWIDFWQFNDIFEPPSQNELIIWKTDSRFFFSLASPALRIQACEAHALALTLLLRNSKPVLGKKPTVLQSKIRATLAITELYATNEIMIKKHVLFLTWLVRDDNYLSW